MIYLDYSANTPVDPAVLDIYCKTELAYIANPNSTHCAGQAAPPSGPLLYGRTPTG